jgi:hypothetical protein
VLPEERFWKRYSPHHEFPLSSIASFSLHLLFLGLLVMAAWLAYVWGINSPPAKVPTEAVRLAGGGGGPKHGKTPGSGQNPDQPGERPDEKAEPDKATDLQPVKLDANDIASIPKEVSQDPLVRHVIAKGKNVSFLKDIDSEAGKMLRRGVHEAPGSGRGGPGTDGGKDGGKDKSVGDDKGQGDSGKLNEREKRMLRWVMSFDTHGVPGEYYRQLDGLGAIIAIPDPKELYKIIHYPKGVKPVSSVKELNRIYWKDYDPRSVLQMMAALHRPERPSHFVAFMPQELEQRLFDMEKAHATSQGKTIDDIDETRFEVFKVGGKYVPSLKSVTFK